MFVESELPMITIIGAVQQLCRILSAS